MTCAVLIGLDSRLRGNDGAVLVGLDPRLRGDDGAGHVGLDSRLRGNDVCSTYRTGFPPAQE